MYHRNIIYRSLRWWQLTQRRLKYINWRRGPTCEYSAHKRKVNIKGAVLRDFLLQVFSWIMFFQAPEIKIWASFLTALIRYSGAWGKLIHEKNLKSKISWHCPFKCYCAKNNKGMGNCKNQAYILMSNSTEFSFTNGQKRWPQMIFFIWHKFNYNNGKYCSLSDSILIHKVGHFL